MCAQNFQWADFPVTTNTSGTSSIGYSTTCDNLGNVYCVGFKDNQFNAGAVYGHLFYRKYNTNGVLIFDKTISGKVRNINLTSDSAGNIYFVGAFKNIISFEGGGLINSSSSSEENILVKFDSNGVFLWNQNISNFGAFNHFTAIATDSNNDIYIGIDNFNSSKILKLATTNGTVLQTIEQVNVQIITSLSIDDLGNIYASGSCGKTTSMFAGVSQPTNLDYSYYAVKYNPNGSHQWTKYIQSISCLDSQISAKTSNNIYFSATLTGAYAFGSLTTLGPPSGFSDDIFVTKLDVNGNFIWVREVAGSGKASIGKQRFLISDSNENVYFVGTTRSTTVWSPTMTTIVTGFGDDALLLKYNSNGDLLLAKQFGGQSSDRCDSVGLDSSGNIYVAGIKTGNVAFDGISNSGGTNVPYLAKIGNNLNTKNFIEKSFAIYPNPSQNEITILLNAKDKAEGNIINLLGQKVMNFEVGDKTSISVLDFENGIYFVKIKGFITQKFIKN